MSDVLRKLQNSVKWLEQHCVSQAALIARLEHNLHQAERDMKRLRADIHQLQHKGDPE